MADRTSAGIFGVTRWSGFAVYACSHQYLYHLRGYVDSYAVLRTWSTRRGWRYECVHLDTFLGNAAWERTNR